MKKNASENDRYEIKDSSNEKFYFALKAANHQVIGQSQMYESKSSAESGVQSVMNNTPDASIDDQTD